MAPCGAICSLADDKRGRTPDDDNRPKGKDGQPKKSGRGFARDFGVPKPTEQDNFTDPDSRIMKTSAGFEQCYKRADRGGHACAVDRGGRVDQRRCG
jgi:hypothetical protein